MLENNPEPCPIDLLLLMLGKCLAVVIAQEGDLDFKIIPSIFLMEQIYFLYSLFDRTLNHYNIWQGLK